MKKRITAFTMLTLSTDRQYLTGANIELDTIESENVLVNVSEGEGIEMYQDVIQALYE